MPDVDAGQLDVAVTSSSGVVGVGVVVDVVTRRWRAVDATHSSRLGAPTAGNRRGEMSRGIVAGNQRGELTLARCICLRNVSAILFALSAYTRFCTRHSNHLRLQQKHRRSAVESSTQK